MALLPNFKKKDTSYLSSSNRFRRSSYMSSMVCASTVPPVVRRNQLPNVKDIKTWRAQLTNHLWAHLAVKKVTVTKMRRPLLRSCRSLNDLERVVKSKLFHPKVPHAVQFIIWFCLVCHVVALSSNLRQYYVKIPTVGLPVIRRWSRCGLRRRCWQGERVCTPDGKSYSCDMGHFAVPWGQRDSGTLHFWKAKSKSSCASILIKRYAFVFMLYLIVVFSPFWLVLARIKWTMNTEAYLFIYSDVQPLSDFAGLSEFL